MDERDKRLRIAQARVDAFIRKNPDCSREGVKQPSQGVNNLVVFARKDDRMIVFKAFIWPEFKARECYAMRHWQKTGLVPELLCDLDSEKMIIMSWLEGDFLGNSIREEEGEEAWRNACRTTGHAAGSLTRVPMTDAQKTDFESRFHEGSTLEGYLGQILSLGRSVQSRDPDFRDQFWKDNLDFMEEQQEAILAQPRVLYHEDVGNLHVHAGRFVGFFDLEMSRVGCAAMQLGTLLKEVVCRQGEWDSFRKGWEEASGRQLSLGEKRAAVAASHFLSWRIITRYLTYDGTPGTGAHWASPADPVRFRKEIEGIQEMVGIGSP